MNDSKTPDNCGLLEASLDDTNQDYDNLLTIINEFVKNNPKINKYNKLEFNVLYRCLGSFYRSVINTTN